MCFSKRWIICYSERDLNKKCPLCVYETSGIEVLKYQQKLCHILKRDLCEGFGSVICQLSVCILSVTLLLEIDMDVSGNGISRNHIWWWSVTLFSLPFLPRACSCAVETEVDTLPLSGTGSGHTSIFGGLGIECFIVTKGFRVCSVYFVREKCLGLRSREKDSGLWRSLPNSCSSTFWFHSWGWRHLKGFLWKSPLCHAFILLTQLDCDFCNGGNLLGLRIYFSHNTYYNILNTDRCSISMETEWPRYLETQFWLATKYHYDLCFVVSDRQKFSFCLVFPCHPSHSFSMLSLPLSLLSLSFFLSFPCFLKKIYLTWSWEIS